MIIYKKFFSECIIFKLKEYKDRRGYFAEMFNEKVFAKKFKKEFKCKQVNFIVSKKNSLRGLHFQKKPFSQKKILRVINGKILDVVVDIRKKSKSFGNYKTIILSDKNKKFIYIPDGFAHGYMTLSRTAKIEYFCSNFYNKNSEITIKWDDPNIKIKWPYSKRYEISKKDRKGILLNDYK